MNVIRRGSWAALLLVLASGCYGTENLRKEMDRTSAENEELREELRTLKNEMELRTAESTMLRSEFTSVKEAWSAMEKSFSPEMREELAKNLEAATAAVQSAKDAGQAAGEALEAMRSLATEAERLKELCAKHEAQSKDLNRIGAMQAQCDSMINEMASLRSKMSQVENTSRMTEHEARTLKTRLQHAESRLQSIGSRVGA